MSKLVRASRTREISKRCCGKEDSVIQPTECSLRPGAVHLFCDVGRDRRKGIQKGTRQSVLLGYEYAKARIEAHLPELKASRCAGRAKWEVKVETPSKAGMREHVEGGRQQEPPTQPRKVLVLGVSPRWPAAPDADVWEYRIAPHHQPVPVAVDIPHFRSF